MRQLTIQNAAGNLVGKISNTTRGIYLRSCRAVWNECVSLGYLTNQEYPFSNIQKKTALTRDSQK